MPRSNLKRRSNVYLRRTDKALKDDARFVQQVRGAVAIQRLLKMLAVPPGRAGDADVEKLVRQGRLTAAQQQQRQWQIRCSACDAMPCGVGFDGSPKFRCPLPDCR